MNALLRILAFVLPLLVLGGGCATAPRPSVPAALFDDAGFARPAAMVDRRSLFALSPAMRGFVEHYAARRSSQRDPRAGLAAALYDRGQLKIDYDSAFTRTAAESFEDRAGNCLSLVIMTAAFAKELGLEVSYRSAVGFDTWGRQGNLLVHSGHVNLTLGGRKSRDGSLHEPSVTIDFLPAEQVAGLRTREIDEATVVAMFLNNRAAELLAAGRVDDAYWHARRAVENDPSFASAVNTLGVVYLRSGRPAPAEAAFRHALLADADNPRVLANLATALEAQGRTIEARALRTRLAGIEPEPPYHWFQLGLAAAQRGDWHDARDLFEREVKRADFNPEFHHWLAIAYWNLQEDAAARRELALAVETSSIRSDRERYAAKLVQLAELGRGGR